ncbi:hypothetical protein J2Z44_002880 [Clostridium punense]|uniref:Transposase n=1 Tax=Clostridium punense TaxID=1054297 RepID=A0ABS4K6Z7_9CLOT|nr:hypothetical protein [Clostridium punense]
MILMNQRNITVYLSMMTYNSKELETLINLIIRAYQKINT